MCPRLWKRIDGSLRELLHVAAHSPGISSGPLVCDSRFTRNLAVFRVGDSGFEPLTSSASRKRSPPELIALVCRDLHPRPRGGTRNRTGVQGFADPCLTTRPCRQSRRLKL